MKKIMAAAGVTAALLLTSACGGDRPSAAELSDVLQSQSSDALPIDKEAADCAAELLVDSDISNGTLRDIADEEIDITGYVVRMPEDDIKAWDEITDDVIECVVG